MDIKKNLEDCIDENNHSNAIGYEEYIERLSKRYDKLFVTIPDLIGGKCFFESENNSLKITVDLYIKRDGQWLNKKESFRVPFSKFTDEGLEKLESEFKKRNGKIEFDIDKPSNIEELKKKSLIKNIILAIFFIGIVIFCIFTIKRNLTKNVVSNNMTDVTAEVNPIEDCNIDENNNMNDITKEGD